MVSPNDHEFICLNPFWTRFQTFETGRVSGEGPALKPKIRQQHTALSRFT